MITLLRIFLLFISAGIAHSSANLTTDDGPFSFRGIDLAFVRADLPELSPLMGVENPLLAGYRLHGHLRKVRKNQEPLFEKPKYHSNCRGFGYEPTDFTSALIERLAPSCAGYVANASRADPINDHNWLSPSNVAKILLLTRNPDFFENTTAARKKAFEDLTFLLLPELLFKKALRGKLSVEGAPNSNRGKKRAIQLTTATPDQWWIRQQPLRGLSKAEKKFRKEKSDDFAKLLYGAFLENHGERGHLSGYPPHMVEQILLGFLWEKHRDLKTGLRPYIEEIVKAGCISKKDAELIIWDGPTAKYEAADYYAAKKYLAALGEFNKQDLESRIVTTGFLWGRREVSLREYVTLKNLGFAYFEDPQPPVAGYGTCYREINGHWEPESDCGEALIWDTMMHMLYNPSLKRFGWEKLVEWKTEGCSNLGRGYTTDEFVKLDVDDALIAFFRDSCPTPQHIKSPHVRTAWGNLLSDLNRPNDPHPIKYLKPEGNPTYSIGPGVHNALKVIGHLLGDPEWWPKDKNANLLEYQLKRFCTIASPDAPFHGNTITGYFTGHDTRTYWDYSLEPFRGKYIVPADPALAKIFTKPKLNQWQLADNLITVVFKKHTRDYGRKSEHNCIETTSFEWRCQPAHFDFAKVGIANPSQISIDNMPLAPDVRTLCELVYSQNMSSFDGRILALKMIFTYLKQTDNLDITIRCTDETRYFKQLVQRWLEPTGEFFAHWKDPHTTRRVYEVVSRFWSTEDFCRRELTCFFPDLLKDRINAKDVVDMQRILTYDLAIRGTELKALEDKNLEKGIVSRGLLDSLLGDKVQILGGSKDSLKEAMHLLRLAGAEEYLLGFTTHRLDKLLTKDHSDYNTFDY